MVGMVEQDVEGSLGTRLRQARLMMGLSQEALGHPHFSGRYIDAVENGRIRPSQTALDALARRLARPLTPLLDARPAPPLAPDLDALDEDVRYQLDEAQRLLAEHQETASAEVIARIADEIGPALAALPPGTRFRLYRARATAAVRAHEPGRARPDLQAALVLAREQGDAEQLAWIQMALGVLHYEEGQPRKAMAYYDQALQAIPRERVHNRELRLRILINLATSLWAAYFPERAVSIYREALDLLRAQPDPARRKVIYWGLSLAYRALDELDHAKLFGWQTLKLCEVGGSREEIGQAASNLGWILTARGEHEQAAALLAWACKLLEDCGHQAILSTAYEHYADVERRRGRLAEARTYAARSRELSAAVYARRPDATEPQKAIITRAYALALRTSALVEEQAGQPAAADKLLTEALAVITFAETAAEIELDYAALLAARGLHEQATLHYRAAVQHQPRLRNSPLFRGAIFQP